MPHMLWILLLALLISCSPRSEVSTHSFRIYEENSVTIAETRGGPKYEGEIFTYEKVLELKEDPDRPESMLYRPGTIQIGDDGCYYILDPGDCRIVVFDAEGQYLRSFGRKGDGPGEFRGMRLLRFTGEVMTIFDFSLRRATCFRIDGTLLDTYRAPVTFPPTSSSFERLDDGGFVLFPRTDYTNEPDNPVISYSAQRIMVVGAAGDTLCDIQTPFVPWGFKVQTETSSGAHRMEFIGAPELLFLPERGILMSTGIEPELTWFNTDGVIIERIVLDLEPAPVSPEERERIRQDAQEEYERSKEQMPVRAKVVLESLRIPEDKAFWERIYLDDAGFYWLRLPESMTTEQPPGGPLHRVLNPEGEYLGQSRWPIWSATFRRGLFMGRAVDEETGAVIPTIYRIHPAVPGLRYP